MENEKNGKSDRVSTDVDEINEMISLSKKQDGLDTGKISDGYHTFHDLYEQRKILSAVLFSTWKGISWKSKKHADGKRPFGGGWFVVGIETPEGQYTYHYKMEDWDLFDVREVERAPKWDHHTAADVKRLLSLMV